ncbi:hypothetical protein OTU49_008889 [Cherax quadricarinatus]|uniref:Apolipoprotein D n=1 Tax=Cherax quadricarinatus TaxID=27406 RepID=A0AAW0WNB9_CHEQU|nr:apolipoprotein D-like [Cherax quadricarinatus]
MMPLSLCLMVMMVVIVAPPAATQVIFGGRCPVQNVVQNFNAAGYLGKWYEIEKYFTIFEVGGRCITATYYDLGTMIGVLNQQTSVFGNKVTSIQGQAQFVNPASREAKLSVTFGNSIFGMLSAGNNGNYWVLDTDYFNYAIVWACQDITFANAQFLWILMRQQKPDPQLLYYVKTVIRQRGLDVSRLQVTDQTNCF